MTRSRVPASTSESRIPARCKIVEEHVRLENQHDLDGVMSTFGTAARYDDEPWGEHHIGWDQVRANYVDLFSAMPDLKIDVRERHATETTIVLEVVITGHHRGVWRGLPATGRRVEFPLCGLFTFDESDRLTGEKIYYDRAMILRQLGVFHEPEKVLGRINVALMHPFTIAQIVVRKVFGR
jgi:steroid delta-isomerase-like uncharacterized protein